MAREYGGELNLADWQSDKRADKLKSTISFVQGHMEQSAKFNSRQFSPAIWCKTAKFLIFLQSERFHSSHYK